MTKKYLASFIVRFNTAIFLINQPNDEKFFKKFNKVHTILTSRAPLGRGSLSEGVLT